MSTPHLLCSIMYISMFQPSNSKLVLEQLETTAANMQKIILVLLVTALVISNADAWRFFRKIKDKIRSAIARTVVPPHPTYPFPYPRYYKRDDNMNEVDLEEMKREEEELAEVERYLTEEFIERDADPDELEEMKRFIESQEEQED